MPSRTLGLDARRDEDEDPLLRVVRVVGAGVVLERVDPLVAADGADGAPEQVAEVDDQVGRDAVHLGVDLLREVDLRRDRVPVLVRNRLQPPLEVGAHALVVLGRDRALRLAVAHVEEDPRVVAALAPRRRARPVDADVGERRAALGLAHGLQQALAAEPLVDADAAVHALRAVVGDDEDRRLVVGVLEQTADQPVDMAVVVEDRVLVRAAGERACGARGPCPSRTRGASGRGPSRPSRRAPTASSRAGARRARSAGRSSRTPGGGGTPCPPCGSP